MPNTVPNGTSRRDVLRNHANALIFRLYQSVDEPGDADPALEHFTWPQGSASNRQIPPSWPQVTELTQLGLLLRVRALRFPLPNVGADISLAGVVCYYTAADDSLVYYAHAPFPFPVEAGHALQQLRATVRFTSPTVGDGSVVSMTTFAYVEARSRMAKPLHGKKLKSVNKFLEAVKELQNHDAKLPTLSERSAAFRGPLVGIGDDGQAPDGLTEVVTYLTGLRGY